MSPRISFAYGEESRENFVTSLGQPIGEADISIGRLTFGPEFGYSLKRQDGTVIEPQLKIEGLWNFTTDGDVTLSNGTILGDDEFRVRIEGGVQIRKPNGVGVRGTLTYDGIGADEFEAVTGKLWINIPLQDARR